MKHATLFSGIGGPEIAAEEMEWENVFHCEWNPFGKRILEYYWPNSISYHDITKTNFIIHRGQIDVLTGGFPCQPYSIAGKRLGTDDNRHLWPHMLRAIDEIQPRWVVGENVLGITNWNGGMVLKEIQADLEAKGYEVFTNVLPACGINAPHQRYRTFIIAYSLNFGTKQPLRTEQQEKKKIQGRKKFERIEPGTDGSNESNTDTKSKRTRRISDKGKQERSQVGNVISRIFCRVSDLISTNTSSQRRGEILLDLQQKSSNGSRIDRIGQQDYWHSFPSQSPVCSGNDGLPGELDGITIPSWITKSTEGYGNAIVPQLILQIYKAIQEYEDLIH